LTRTQFLISRGALNDDIIKEKYRKYNHTFSVFLTNITTITKWLLAQNLFITKKIRSQSQNYQSTLLISHSTPPITTTPLS